jgi:hypothetical protein
VVFDLVAPATQTVETVYIAIPCDPSQMSCR